MLETEPKMNLVSRDPTANDKETITKASLPTSTILRPSLDHEKQTSTNMSPTTAYAVPVQPGKSKFPSLSVKSFYSASPVSKIRKLAEQRKEMEGHDKTGEVEPLR
jgi:hypothetical protein